ncbi:MAG TPA: glycine zipper domain-containing protein [Rhizomicrobium sp.]|nr:glycine zipper domain-containing protein [Rhizomicrobium sp.]
MLKHTAAMIVAGIIVLGATTVAATADSCSGHDHTTGTILGAGGGAVLGGVATNSAVGAVGGAVLGGLAGNAIARNNDCDRHDRRDYRRHHHHQRYHNAHRG